MTTLVDLAPGALRGSYVPLVTPFRHGEVDLATYASLVRRQASAGSAGIVLTGTSGEPSVLTVEERVRLYETAVAAAGARLPVVAATGSQALPETEELTRAAEKAGAAAVLIVTPYYIKPPQRGLVEYFVQIAAVTSLPVLIYHIPGRSAVTLSVAALAEAVRRAPNIVGVKHASADLAWATELLTELGPSFRLFCGLEEMSFPMLALGAAGLMNAAANIAPTPIGQLCQAVADGDLAMARRLHFELFTLNQAVFWDTNPIPVKYLMYRLGLLPSNEHRLPMSPPPPELETRLDALLPQLLPIAGVPA
ncbi:4-hydroxy-tetrahydrodipicolinate synthase [Kribbella orskensis]|uniref:4-hydroxy-tetrahydrodipicolinate synthase n=1 Tax=Kribbella orskensis TaxID=2512216 RepID=A0ABY2BUY8_9ACTN|nr:MULTISPECIES: 4-hydroxy-tetrahydrodipicolinate synthase [Kribbella]TCN44187.1 4-hydroxy-tetrahydrodipicolinate synthase [Kribbella sp. VKM Ac-2500]TCO32035.1 4-hydroxy-tetrahydrodipicolinate synthase [Kribbella orskensis]